MLIKFINFFCGTADGMGVPAAGGTAGFVELRRPEERRSHLLHELGECAAGPSRRKERARSPFGVFEET